MTFRYGADYYPEYWPKERWAKDAEMMQAAGINVVRMAEFAWTAMEASEGVFTFEWLDEVIELLAGYGIQSVLCTPTASPPAWVMHADESQFLVMEDGRRKTYGGRREYCPTHPGYRAASDRITTAMAEHFGNNENVIGWQTDNEFGDKCFCDICRTSFQQWLKAKYGTLEALNAAWGTRFWSHTYLSWEEIPAMRNTADVHNPGLGLDYKRFMSDTYVDFQQRQIDILRAKAPGQFITHNLMGFNYDHINYFDLTASLDHVSWDNYVRVFWNPKKTVDLSRPALNHDTMRGLKKQPFWVMEEQSGPTGGWLIADSPRPGEIRAWAYQAVAHGADGIVYFRWRTCRQGVEEYWHGILDHHGEPTRRYREVAQMGQEIQIIGDLIEGSMPKSQVAMVQSYDVGFGFHTQPTNEQFSYKDHFLDLYRALWQQNVAVDIVSELEENLADYKLVILPAFYVLSEKTAQLIKDYVEQGGVVLCTGRTGVKDQANAVVNQRLPGLLREMCGVRVEEYDSMPADGGNSVVFNLPQLRGEPIPLKIWAEWLEPEGAEVIARFGEDYLTGQAAITVNDFGKGKAVYAGLWGDTTLFAKLNEWLLPLAGVQTLKTPAGIEITRRVKDDIEYSFVINHGTQTQHVSLEHDYEELLTDAILFGGVSLAPQDVLVLKRKLV